MYSQIAHIHSFIHSRRYGFESSNFILSGLTVRSYTSVVDQLLSLGFNTIRVPFSNQMLHYNASPIAVDYELNSDLQGLTPLQCLDALVSYCGRVGMRIILTRVSCKASNEWNELFWFIPDDPYYTENQYNADWMMLASRYGGKMAASSCSLLTIPCHIAASMLYFCCYSSRLLSIPFTYLTNSLDLPYLAFLPQSPRSSVWTYGISRSRRMHHGAGMDRTQGTGTWLHRIQETVSSRRIRSG